MWGSAAARTTTGPVRPAPPPRRRPPARSTVPTASRTPVRSSSARAATMAATVVTTDCRRAPSPESVARGRGRWRRPSPRRTAPWSAAAPISYQRSSAVTPSAPPVASAHSEGRPTRVARAPSANALTTSGDAAHAAVDVDLGPAGDRVDDLGQDVGRRRGVGQLARPVVRHDDGRRPGLDAPHRVVRPLHALRHDGERAQPGQPPDVVGGERRLELVGDDGHEAALAGAVGAVPGQVGQGQVVGQVHAHPPLAQAESRDRGVDGQDERAGSRARRPGRTSSAVRARSRRM